MPSEDTNILAFKQHRHLKAWKISITYTVIKIYEKIYQSLRDHAIKTINFIEKKMNLLTNEQQKSYENAKICDT